MPLSQPCKKWMLLPLPNQALAALVRGMHMHCQADSLNAAFMPVSMSPAIATASLCMWALKHQRHNSLEPN